MENFQDTTGDNNEHAVTLPQLRGLPKGAAGLIINTLHPKLDRHAAITEHLA